jgi:DNA-binding transcriptional LysR family regulator
MSTKKVWLSASFRYTGLVMELHHFRYFVAVAENLSFTKAAKHLRMAQPPLSRQISSLEKELGVQLFERRSGKIFLTEPGFRFLNAARLVLEQAASAVDVARQAENGELGTIRVGLGKGLGDVVSLVINQHMRLFPNIEIDVADFISGLQTERLINRKIDVGFLHGPANSPEITSEKLFKERLSVLLPRSNPLARRSGLRLKDLRAETFLLIQRSASPTVHELTLALIRDAGLNPKIIPTETTCYDDAGAMMVASGRGIYVAVGKNPCHPSFADQLVALPLSDPAAFIEVHLAWRKGDSSTTILNFINTSRALLGRTSGIQDMRKFPQIIRPAAGTRNHQRKRK